MSGEDVPGFSPRGLQIHRKHSTAVIVTGKTYTAEEHVAILCASRLLSFYSIENRSYTKGKSAKGVYDATLTNFDLVHQTSTEEVGTTWTTTRPQSLLKRFDKVQVYVHSLLKASELPVVYYPLREMATCEPEFNQGSF